ncbi:YaeQ family protein [Algibacillus agarilyticus]|uniref:YaeQ family protein n=1 Tax=Algibacillus agarilyticus TaxID=2234133 RepID=UPI000DD0E36D|nr:YaeQ family protein [Algibacillus agarilyticus]
MSYSNLLVSAQFDVSRIDSDNYEHFTQTLAYSSRITPFYFVEKLLACALLHHSQMQISPNCQQFDEPELYIRRNQSHYLHWCSVGTLTLDSLEKAKAKSEHVWLFYCDKDKNEKLLNKINKHPQLQMIELQTSLIESLSRSINKKLSWSIIIDHEHLMVASEDGFFESTFKIHHPLTVPIIDFIH